MVVVGGFIIIALGWGTFSVLSSDDTTINTAPATTDGERTDKLTLSEVGLHNKQEDCWMVIRGKVYDVTTFYTHPGGEAILEGCGTDATSLFESRPMGSGTPHSNIAEQALLNFYIGDLE